MKWVTRKGVKFDRSACAWLILRQIDQQAEFEYVAPEEMDTAIAAGAHPFHNVGFTGPGTRKQSSFADVMDEYKLTDNPALDLMREYIDNGEIGSENTGGDDTLRAIIKGVNAQVKSDDEMVAKTLPIYDALFTYCQRKATGKTKWAGLEPGWGQ